METKTKSILVVDDEEGYRKVLLNYLKERGYHVMVAKTGSEALKEIESRDYSILILDFMLPDMDGKELLESIRVSRTVPNVVIITAYPDNDDLLSIAEKDVIRVVRKPFSMDEIKSCLDELS